MIGEVFEIVYRIDFKELILAAELSIIIAIMHSAFTSALIGFIAPDKIPDYQRLNTMAKEE